MIECFFQSLEREGVAYLLISGQATVLYGAAVFSEDIDLWIKPTTDNAKPMLAALQANEATYYKLTPPLEESYLRRGHGFHFRVPGSVEWYLDIMGQPPRVPGFDDAWAAAELISTPWGRIPTIGIKHLAALKTTQRLGDYPIISRLVLCYLESVGTPTNEDYLWAIENLHTTDELEDVLRAYPAASLACEALPLRAFASSVSAGEGITSDVRTDVERWLSERMIALRQADREYWRDIIDELRGLRREGQLMPVGSVVNAEH